jgi:putative YhdH/YhfP family quinone oxidoreductase
MNLSLNATYSAIQVHTDKDGELRVSFERLPFSQLNANQLLVKISYSSINYKDILTITGKDGFHHNYPHVPGIDAVGEVVESKSNKYKNGDRVLVMASGMGLQTDGGLAQYAYVREEWVMRLPEFLTEKEAMVYGTAGLTAAFCVDELLKRTPINSSKPILVTGGASGVGLTAVLMLLTEGKTVFTSTSSQVFHNTFGDEDSLSIINGLEDSSNAKFSLLPERWSGCIDTTGSQSLNIVLKSLCKTSAVICAGMTAGIEIEINLYPFILRAISMVGVNTESMDQALRHEVMKKYMQASVTKKLTEIANEITLKEVPEFLNFRGERTFAGRTIVRM